MTYEGELYLEGHNGTFTSMAEHKYYNRYMEQLLRDTEIFYYWAELTRSYEPSFSHNDIKEMWHIFLIDQFHDVLPGTCTKMTVDDTRKNFAELKEKCQKICQEAISAILGTSELHIDRILPHQDKISNENDQVLIFNSSNLNRSDLLSNGSQKCFSP